MARSRNVAAEVAASLAKGQPHPQATAADWKKLISEIQQRAKHESAPQVRALLQRELDAAHDGLRKAAQVVAMKPTFLTSTNLFALKEVVLRHGPSFPSRLPATEAPHLKRCVAAGMVAVEGPTAHLTPAGREVVADAIVKDLERWSKYTPRENTLVADKTKRAELLTKEVAEHQAKLQHLEDTLARLR